MTTHKWPLASRCCCVTWEMVRWNGWEKQPYMVVNQLHSELPVYVIRWRKGHFEKIVQVMKDPFLHQCTREYQVPVRHVKRQISRWPLLTPWATDHKWDSLRSPMVWVLGPYRRLRQSELQNHVVSSYCGHWQHCHFSREGYTSREWGKSVMVALMIIVYGC